MKDSTVVTGIIVVAATIFIFFLLTGCSSLPPQVLTVEKPVVIPGIPEFLPVPPAMFVGCLPPAAPGPDNGDLLLHDHLEAQYAACLQGRLDAIKALK